ncbi:MAG: patatin-like phospholipase family protein [Spirochaetes bacterium]|jgi:NTE family protein|nr:patatin-like phospholipase family protein [Spirochaetota bacterium]
MMNKKDGYCLVLGGGGAKGVYHEGAWRALRELEIPVTAVVGNSVGAVIAGFIAQNNHRGLSKVVDNIGIDNLVSFPQDLVVDGEFKLTRSNFSAFDKFRKKVFQKRGLDTSPLKKLLHDNLSEKKLRDSGIDLGVVTYKLSDLKPLEIFIDQMEPGTVLGFLQASATLPGFAATEINQKKFIDGGVHDNVPFAMAKSRGYKKIIVIDISGLGMNKRPDIIGTETVYIKNSINMGGVLDFDKQFLRDYRQLGYLDTLKAFGALVGIRYSFSSNPALCKKLLELLNEPSIIRKIGRLSGKKTDTPQAALFALRSLLPTEMRHHKSIIHALADCSASALLLPRIRLYSFEELIQAISEGSVYVKKQVRSIKKAVTKKQIRSLIRQLKKIAKKGDSLSATGKSPFFYDQIIQLFLTDQLRKVPLASLKALHPEIIPCGIFLDLLQLLNKNRK